MCARSRMDRRPMAARSSLTLLLSLAPAAGGVLQVRGQRAPSIEGFITIDCGLPKHSSYVNNRTKIPITSDAGFTDAGYNHNISTEIVRLPVCTFAYKLPWPKHRGSTESTPTFMICGRAVQQWPGEEGVFYALKVLDVMPEGADIVAFKEETLIAAIAHR
ncbi:uncharacterized protein LOC125529724 [Triticum urartu]|uniref:uncharacterized protein LOC125529724 n=1 Tax=Triticum urartu TaxID=4572 RepID=UPI002044A2B6|nr:uncharacterized protein LOC125529724 [Triticum urartu]